MMVYIVTSGEYSDYMIHEAFSTKEYAQEFIDRYSKARSWWSNVDIEEYPVDCALDGLNKTKNLFLYQFTFDKEFNFVSVEKEYLMDMPDSTAPAISLYTKNWWGTCCFDVRQLNAKSFTVHVSHERVQAEHLGWLVHVYASNKDKAFKVATDLLHQHRANLVVTPTEVK